MNDFLRQSLYNSLSVMWQGTFSTPQDDAEDDAFMTMTLAYVRRNFDLVVYKRSDDELRGLIRILRARSEAQDFRTDHDIHIYIWAVAVFGAFFDENPQYTATLREAGWIDEDGNSVPGRDVDAILPFTARWHEAYQADYIAIETTIRGAADAYMKAQALDVIGSGFSMDDTLHSIRTLSPRRFALMDERDHEAWYAACTERAEALHLRGANHLAYCLGAFMFGLGFEDDPFLPWAGETLRRNGVSDNERVIAWSIAAQDYFIDMIERHKNHP